MTIQDYARRFRKAFPDLGSGNNLLDQLLTASTRTPHLDTFALEDAIVAKHGEIPDGVSLEAAITTRYGQAAAAFAREAI